MADSNESEGAEPAAPTEAPAATEPPADTASATDTVSVAPTEHAADAEQAEPAETGEAAETAEATEPGETTEAAQATKSTEKPTDADLRSRLEQVEDEPAVTRIVEATTIQEQIDEEQIVEFQARFQAAYRQRFTKEEFRVLLEEVASVTYDDATFDVLFMKIDACRDGFVDWDEFISHLLLEFQEKDAVAAQISLEVPINKEPRVFRSNHRHPLCRITFYPAVLADRSVSFLRGSYLTCSADGTINYWSLDFECERSSFAAPVNLKVATTWITDLVCLPDVNIIATSSTERDVRFYDTTARQFDLRVVISSWEYAVMCMHYHFETNAEEDSRLICGDIGGCVRVLVFNSRGKGPFHHTPGVDVCSVIYNRLEKGDLRGMRVVDFRYVHQDWVRQVSYYPTLHSFISCGVCPTNSMYLCDVSATKTQYGFHVQKGVSCFAFDEDTHVLVSGGPDCLVRVWNTFVPKKASCVFQGHHACIVAIVIQDAGARIFSISKDRCVKVWDMASQTCLQTYNQLPPEVGEHASLSVFYNPLNRCMVVGCAKIATIILGERIDEEITDGNTHTKPVTVVLYNPLFKCIVSCGMDSCIMVWNPWKGQRMFLVKDAHTGILYGEHKPVEITAATFDPGYQLLLTGARDGTVKMWNFNTGTCIRHMEIEHHCEVTCVVWLRARILAVGWNRHVTEFADSGKLLDGKNWELRHTEDVLATAVRPPQCIATSSYSGELILWRLETGQAYKKYHVANPSGFFKLQYMKEKESKGSTWSASKSSARTHHGAGRPGGMESANKRRQSLATLQPGQIPYSAERAGPTPAQADIRVRRVSVVALPKQGSALRTLAVHAMIFLCSRPMQADVGTLLVSLENGHIQMWSHHSGGGILMEFFAIHTVGDYVVSMATDPENDYLFTGTTAGYIKVWLMKNYGQPEPVKVVMPLLRLQFPFMWKDWIEGRAKRANRDQPLPVLLNSYRGHLSGVTSLEYVSSSKILISGSTDNSVRLWALSGRYIGTLGSFHPWNPIPPGDDPGPDYPYRAPADVGRVGSCTTMRVFRGGRRLRDTAKKKSDDMEEMKDIPAEVLEECCYGQSLTAPILGKNFKMPSRAVPPARLPVLDISMPRIPVYCHLRLSTFDDIGRPETPPVVTELRTTKTKSATTVSPLTHFMSIVSTAELTQADDK